MSAVVVLGVTAILFVIMDRIFTGAGLPRQNPSYLFLCFVTLLAGLLIATLLSAAVA